MALICTATKSVPWIGTITFRDIAWSKPMRRVHRAGASLMDQAPYVLNEPGRNVVLDAIRKVCLHRPWTLLAAHVRTNHIHVVVEADAKPEKVMNAFKSYASRRLNEVSAEGAGRKRWARHGSTRWLMNRDDVAAAIRYVVD